MQAKRTEGPAACSVDECERPACTRGYCTLHYVRVWKHGDPTIVKDGGAKEARPIPERFWEKVRKDESGCWVWQGSKTRGGYGSFAIKRKGVSKMHRAHRMAWELTNGPIPDGLLVCHHCDNPPCVNPAHLFLGTVSDNTQDMLAKGRGFRAYNERSGNCKFSNEQVAAIRARYAEGGLSFAQVAREFGTVGPWVSDIVQHKARPVES